MTLAPILPRPAVAPAVTPVASPVAHPELLALVGRTPSPASAPNCRTPTPASGPNSKAWAQAA